MYYTDGMSNQPDPYWERTRYNPNLRRDATYIAQNVGSGSGGWFWGILVGIGVVFWPSYALHGETQVAASIAWYGTIGILLVWFLAAVSVKQARKQRPPKGRLRVEATTASQLKPPPASICVPPPICLHRNAVPVDNLLGGEPWAWLCPKEAGGCGAELPADWKPAPAPPPVAVPAAGWSWEWHCTCGRARTGRTSTEAAARATINRGVAAHQGYGHRYEYRWWPGIG